MKYTTLKFPHKVYEEKFENISNFIILMNIGYLLKEIKERKKGGGSLNSKETTNLVI